MERTCKKCGETKPIEKFRHNKNCKYGRGYMCNKCRHKQYRPKEIRIRFEKYGISLDFYNEMFNSQQGRCQICNIHHSELKRRLAIDHNHETKKVRGLLCDSCNSILGYAKEDCTILINAIKYLQEYKT